MCLGCNIPHYLTLFPVCLSSLLVMVGICLWKLALRIRKRIPLSLGMENCQSAKKPCDCHFLTHSFSKNNSEFIHVLLIFYVTWTTPLHPIPTLTFPSVSQDSERMGTLAFLVTMVFQLKDDLDVQLLALSIRWHIGLLSGPGILLQFTDLPSTDLWLVPFGR